MARMFKSNRSIFSGLAVVTVLVIVTVIGFAAFLNNRCQRAFWDDLAVYPGAELLEEESVFLGVQQVSYHSPDAPEVVEQWYTTDNASNMREAVVSGDFNSPAEQNWFVEADDQRGGSIFTVETTCP